MEGPDNDVVNVFLNDTLIHTGLSWEGYFIDYPNDSILQAVNALLFRASGTAAPATLGAGYYFHAVEVSNTLPPTPAPTTSPTAIPTAAPNASPTAIPTAAPTASPTAIPTAAPTASPTPSSFTPAPTPAVPQVTPTPEGQDVAVPILDPATNTTSGGIEFANVTAPGITVRGHGKRVSLLDVPLTKARCVRGSCRAGS